MALQLRKKTHESIVYIDSDSAPRIMPSGEDFILEDIPVGTRVLYPNPPLKGLPNREAAIRYALNHPLGCDPLYAQLEPGMKVTIAIDDISLPLPPMATPDIRQTMLEVVLDLLGANARRRCAHHHRQFPAPENDCVGNEAHGRANDF